MKTIGFSEGFTSSLTAGADLGAAFTGANGNDSFNGQVNTPNAPAATSTFNVGDTLTGGSGTDSLNIAVTGATGTGGTLGVGLDLQGQQDQDSPVARDGGGKSACLVVHEGLVLGMLQGGFA